MMYGRWGLGNDFCFGYGMFGGGWDLLMGIGVLIVIASAVYLLMGRGRNNGMRDNAIESLNLKYANGDITEEEYFNRKNVLDKG